MTVGEKKICDTDVDYRSARVHSTHAQDREQTFFSDKKHYNGKQAEIIRRPTYTSIAI